MWLLTIFGCAHTHTIHSDLIGIYFYQSIWTRFNYFDIWHNIKSKLLIVNWRDKWNHWFEKKKNSNLTNLSYILFQFVTLFWWVLNYGKLFDCIEPFKSKIYRIVETKLAIGMNSATHERWILCTCVWHSIDVLELNLKLNVWS